MNSNAESTPAQELLGIGSEEEDNDEDEDDGIKSSNRSQNEEQEPPQVEDGNIDCDEVDAEREQEQIETTVVLAAPSQPETDAEKLQQLRNQALEIDRLSKRVAEEIKMELSPNRTGPRARTRTLRNNHQHQLPSLKRTQRRAGKGKRRHQVAARFRNNPLRSSRKPKSRKLNPIKHKNKKSNRPKKQKRYEWDPTTYDYDLPPDLDLGSDTTQNSTTSTTGTTSRLELPPIEGFSDVNNDSQLITSARARSKLRPLKRKQLGRKPWSKVEAQAQAIVDAKRREVEEKKEARRKASAIATERLKTISIGQWLQVSNMSSVRQMFSLSFGLHFYCDVWHDQNIKKSIWFVCVDITFGGLLRGLYRRRLHDGLRLAGAHRN